MSTTKILEFLLRKGVIPFCSGGASCCFALYSAKISHAADVWASSTIISDDDDDDGHDDDINLVHRHYRESVQHYVVQLRQHSGACLWMSLSSAAMAIEAYRDWQVYATPQNTTWKELSLSLLQRQRPIPFFLRSSVLLTSAGAFVLSFQLYGGWVFWQPEPPMYYAAQ